VALGIALLLISIIGVALSSRLSSRQPQVATLAPTQLPTILPATAAAIAAPIPVVNQPLPPLVFARKGNIWRSDGKGALKQLTTLGLLSYAEHPAVSPSDNSIAFIVVTQPPITTPTAGSSAAPPLTYALYTMNADGTDRRALWQPAQSTLMLLAWAPDGRALYVTVADQNQVAEGQSPTFQLKIARVDLATGN
jgi:hypothetical protein